MAQEGVDTSLLLSNGRRMPIVGLGTWQTDVQDDTKIAIETAIDVGYRHIDTAFCYFNEKFIGDALRKAFDAGKVTRDDMFIVTKLPLTGNRKENLRHFFMKSLNALQLDYIDLYLIHCPITAIKQEDENDIFPIKDGKLLMDTEVDLVETWREMEKLVDEGLARSIGLSNFNSVQIQRIYDNARIKPANLQVECHAYFQQPELLDFCKKLNIVLTAYAPIGSPGLKTFAKVKFGVVFDEKDKLPVLLEDPKVLFLAEKHKKTPAQVLLRFLMQRGIIVIPKSINPKRIAENFQVFDFKLTDEDMKILYSLDRKLRFFDFIFISGMEDHPEYPFKIPF